MRRTQLPAERGLENWQRIQAEEMIRTHLEGNIRISELANACQLSPSHFARCFKQTFGTSVHQWLIQLRMERAKQLLLEPQPSLAEVAFLAGFCDQAALTRAFNRIEKITPLRWRKLNAPSEVLQK